MIRNGFIILLFATGVFCNSCTQKRAQKTFDPVYICLEFDEQIPQAVYASEKLEKALSGNGYFMVNEPSEETYRIIIAVESVILE